MQRRACETLPMRGDAAGLIQSAQHEQQPPRLAKAPLRRRIEKGETLRRRAPRREIEREAGQVRLQDLRRVLRRRAALLRLRPEAIAPARRRAPRPAAALLGGGLGDARRDQTAQPRARVEPRPPRAPAIDDQTHALDGEGGLGERGGEHDLASPLRIRRQGSHLRGGGQIAIERQHEMARIERVVQRRLRAPDLRRSGKEHQRVALGLAERAQRQIRELALKARLLGERPLQPPRLDRKNAALRSDPRRGRARRRFGPGAHQRRHRLAVERGGHGEKAQIRPQRALRLEAQRKAEIGVDRALVELVEQHRGDALERRIALQTPRQHAFGDHFDPRRRADPALMADAVADASAHAFAEALGQARGGRASGGAARLQHQDPPVAAPRRLQQDQRNARRLARARRRLEHRVRRGLKRGCQRRQNGVDRKIAFVARVHIVRSPSTPPTRKARGDR